MSLKSTLMTVAQIDKDSDFLARKIAKAYDIELPPDTSTLDDLVELKLKIRSMSRQILCLEYLLDSADVDQDLISKLLISEKAKIDTLLQDQSSLAIITRYDYNYFIEYYHPEFILDLCLYLTDIFLDHNLEPQELWSLLIRTNGIITKYIIDNFSNAEPNDV